MTLVFSKSGTFLQKTYIDFVAERIAPRGWDVMKTAGLGVWAGQNLRGAVVFHDYNPEAGVMCMSGAGDRGWYTLGLIYKAHRYVFDEAKCQLSVMQVSENNDLMKKTAEHFGYEGVLIPRLRGRNEGEMIYTLPDDKWREHPLTLRAMEKERRKML